MKIDYGIPYSFPPFALRCHFEKPTIERSASLLVLVRGRWHNINNFDQPFLHGSLCTRTMIDFGREGFKDSSGRSQPWHKLQGMYWMVTSTPIEDAPTVSFSDIYKPRLIDRLFGH